MDLLLPTITNGFLLPTGLVLKILLERHAIISSNNQIISTDTRTITCKKSITTSKKLTLKYISINLKRLYSKPCHSTFQISLSYLLNLCVIKELNRICVNVCLPHRFIQACYPHETMGSTKKPFWLLMYMYAAKAGLH